MASNQASAFAFIIVIALFAKATTPAIGQVFGFNPLNVNGLSVNGQLCCTPTGNCLLSGQGLAGAVVKLNCSTRLFGASTTVGQSTTNTAGFFTITVPRVQGLLLGLPIVPCVAVVQLPLDSAVCPTLSSTSGVLVSPVVGTVVSGILGRIQNATTAGFITLRI